MPRSSSNSTATSSAGSETQDPKSAASREHDAADVLARAERYFDAGNDAAAAPLFQQLLRQDPNHVSALHRLALIAQRISMPDRAIRLLRQALRAGADSAELLNDLGAVYVDTGDLENARRCFARCIDRFPQSPLGYVSLAYIENVQGEFAKAESAYLTAIERTSHPFEAQFNLATLYREWGDLNRAIERYDKLFAEQPQIELLREGRARARLQNKDWQNGWQDYEARLLLEDEPAKINLKLPIPRWQGQSLGEKHLLILHEQGVGDEVQFASCYADIIARSEKCTFSCSPRLLPIFQRSFPKATFIGVEPHARETWTPDDVQRFDYFIPAGSLPRYFRHRDSDFRGDPFLKVADRQQVSNRSNKIRVGISWWGGAIADQIHKRSVPLDVFQRLLDVPNVQFVNLQHGCHNDASVSAQLAAIENLETHSALDPYRELDAWFDLIATLDLIISVDNSNVHFAGAIGTPTWLLLPNHPNWRWPYQAQSSHWYSSVEFIRKRSHGDWQSTIDGVAERLSLLADQNGKSAA